ncbi:mRNA decay activator protein ZFP36L2 isoform 2-T3 [Liasis olivaceus]
MLDKKAVGSPVGTSPSSNFTPGFLRRHSTSNLQALANGNVKFPNASLSAPSNFGSLKEPGTGAGGGSTSSSSPTTALLNKENKFRDRSLSENGERSQHLMQQLQQQQQVVVVAAASAGKGGGGGNGGGGGGGSGGGGAPINSTRYKTELCRPFEESGACKYGEKCQFAHGFHELRSLTRHPKYKTELCRTFHTIGFCPYGPRCHFIHNADERRPAPASGSANPPAAQQQPPPPPLQPNPPPHGSHPPHHHPSLHPPHAGSTGDLRAFAPSVRDHPLGPGGGNGTSGSNSSFGIPHPRGGGERPKLHHSLSFSGFSNHQHHHHHHGGAVAQGGLEAAAAAAALLLESPGGSRTPPPPASGGSYCDDLVASSCANNAFAFSAGQELGSLIAPLTLHAPPPPPPPAAQQGCFANAAAFYRCHQQQGAAGGGGSCCPPPGPPASPPFSFQPLRRLSESPVFDAPPSPPDSLSDRESYLSGSLSSGSLSGSESPSLDSGRRLPIFSRLSISDD